MNMKVILSITFTFCYLSTLFSQIQYDVSLRLGNSMISSESYSNFFDYNQREQITEDQYVNRNITYTNDYTTFYSQLGRLELEGSIVFPVAKGFHIRTGLGISYQSISLENKFLGGNSRINNLDTLIGQISTVIINPNFKPCQYENSFSEIITPKDASGILSLLVPLEIEYDIIEKLALRFGGYLQTPISSTHTSFAITSFVVEEFDDYNLCRYVLDQDRDTSGSRFNDLVMGMTLGASYRLGNHIGFEILYRHSFDGTFSESYNNIFSFNRGHGDFNNRSVLIGISYKFGNHEGHEKVLQKD